MSPAQNAAPSAQTQPSVAAAHWLPGIGVSSASGAASSAAAVGVVSSAANAPAGTEGGFSLPAGEAHPTSTDSMMESKKGAVRCRRKPVMS
jgi:hypothetical protein